VVTIDASGIVYTSDPAYSGPDSFVLRGTDQGGLFVDGTITVDVSCNAPVTVSGLSASEAGIQGTASVPACASPVQATADYRKLDGQQGGTPAGTGSLADVSGAFLVPFNSTIPQNARAGDYEATLSLMDAAGKVSTFLVNFTIACPAPPSVAVTGGTLDPEQPTMALDAQTTSQDVCQGGLTLDFVVKDAASITVAQGTQGGISPGQVSTVPLTFNALPFGDYTATLTVSDANGASSTTTYPFHVACPAPEIIGFSTDNNGLKQKAVVSAMAYVAGCGYPATAQVDLTDAQGQSHTASLDVVEATAVNGATFGKIAAAFSGIPDGPCQVSITLTDAQGGTASASGSCNVDLTGPSIDFTPTQVDSIGKVGVTYSDPSGVLTVPSAPPGIQDSTLSGNVDVMHDFGRLAAYIGWALEGNDPGTEGHLILQGPQGEIAIPFASRHARGDVMTAMFGPRPNQADRGALANGFRAIVDRALLPPGDYT
ncbi:MAG: hypothetical protein D6819_09020, partial [Gammaproteobacteria bacterium]